MLPSSVRVAYFNFNKKQNMKKVFYLILATIFLFGCNVTKRTKEFKETKESHVSDTKTKKDSTATSVKTLPSQNSMEFSLKDLAGIMGDFVQKINTGNGGESTIEKRGDKLIVVNATPGSEQKEVKVNNDHQVVVYDSKFVLSEFSKVVERIPLKYYMIFWCVVVIYFRKFICQILSAIFPALQTTRLIKLFVS